MAKHFSATTVWERKAQPFTDNRYSRAHEWRFDGGARVPASASPLSVPPPMSDQYAVDPEEALVAAASSCHMLFFLALCATRGIVVDSYVDDAVGTLDKGADGKLALTRIVLRPRIAFAAPAPDERTVTHIHHESHERCYVANSLKTEITVEPPHV